MIELKRTRQGYVDALIELAASTPELLVLDADVAKATTTSEFAHAAGLSVSFDVIAVQSGRLRRLAQAF